MSSTRSQLLVDGIVDLAEDAVRNVRDFVEVDLVILDDSRRVHFDRGVRRVQLGRHVVDQALAQVQQFVRQFAELFRGSRAVGNVIHFVRQVDTGEHSAGHEDHEQKNDYVCTRAGRRFLVRVLHVAAGVVVRRRLV